MTATRTPIPIRIILPLSIVYFIEAFAFTSLFSYVGFMVQDFHLTDDQDQVGLYAGYIGSSFSFASFLSSFWWGRLSDRYGRKPVLLIGACGSLISTCVFGFSTNIWMAIITRSASGFLNGNIGVVKSYVAAVTDKTNQVKSFSVMQLAWGLGNIMGPLVGGLVSRPCSTYDNLCDQDSLFGRYPYLLPNMVPAVISAAGIVLLYVGLPKEEKKQSYVQLETVKLASKDGSDFSISDESEDSVTDDVSSEEVSSVDDVESIDDNDDQLITNKSSSGVSSKLFKCFPKKKSEKEYRKLDKDAEKEKFSIFKNKMTLATCAIYSVLGAAFTMFDEAFPLWAMATYEKGGIEASTKTIGIIGTINGVSAVFIQLTFFAPVAHYLGLVNLFRFGALLGGLLFVNFPLLNLLFYKPVAMWAVMSVFVFLKVSCGQFAFTAISAIIPNSTPISHVGSANGLGQSLVALTRGISPAVAGTLLSLGFASGRGFPFNQYGIFLIQSVLLFSIAIAMCFLPRSLDAPYEDKSADLTKNGEEADEAAFTHELSMGVE